VTAWRRCSGSGSANHVTLLLQLDANRYVDISEERMTIQ
jgi:hypothetical protein